MTRPKASSVSVPIIHPRKRLSSFRHLRCSSEIVFVSVVEVASVVTLVLHMAVFSFHI